MHTGTGPLPVLGPEREPITVIFEGGAQLAHAQHKVEGQAEPNSFGILSYFPSSIPRVANTDQDLMIR